MLQKALSHITGILLSVLLIAVLLKVTNSIVVGGPIGILIAAGIAFHLLKKKTTKPSLRHLSFGIITGIILITLSSLILWGLISSIFADVAS